MRNNLGRHRAGRLYALFQAAGFTLCMAAICMASLATAQADNIQAFGAGSHAELTTNFVGRPFVVSLWSLDCAPCRQDLALLGELLQQDPEFPLLLISTDPIERRDEALYVLENYQLDHVTSWMFADSFTERLRFSIDPLWYGELPRSYLHAADARVTAHSGVLTRELLDGIFATDMETAPGELSANSLKTAGIQSSILKHVHAPGSHSSE